MTHEACHLIKLPILAAMLTVMAARAAAGPIMMNKSAEPTLSAGKPEFALFSKSQWSTLQIDEVLALWSEPRMPNVTASIGDGYSCGNVRIAQDLRRVSSNICLDCVTLEFIPSGSDHYVLSSLIIDHDEQTKLAARQYSERLLQAAGLPSHRINAIRWEYPLASWTQSWTKNGEIRAVDLRVDTLDERWIVHFALLRQAAPGTPDTEW